MTFDEAVEEIMEKFDSDDLRGKPIGAIGVLQILEALELIRFDEKDEK